MLPDCNKISARICAYLDGELNMAERERLDAHFAGCAACRAELAQQKQAESALAAVRLAAPPAGDLRADFYRRLSLSQEPPFAPKHKKPEWRLAGFALAAGMALVCWRLTPALFPRSALTPPVQIAQTETKISDDPRFASVKKPEISRLQMKALLEKTVESPRVATQQPSAHFVSPRKRRSYFSKPLQVASNNSVEDTPAIHSASPSGTGLIASAKKTQSESIGENRAKFGLSAADGVLSKSAAPEPAHFPATTAAGLSAAMTADALAYAIHAEPAGGAETADDGVNLEVRDEVRGFESSTHVAARLEQRTDGETLTIEAEADNGS